MKRRTLVELVAAAAALPACTRIAAPSRGAARNPWTVPHVLRYTDGQDPVGLNPLNNVHASTSWLAQLWGAWLFRNDRRFEPVPELCTLVPTFENGLLSRDGRRITYKLREAVWSDGVPFTSKDVAFSVAVIRDPATIVTSRNGWELVEHVETPDDRTAIFHLSAPFGAWASTFFATGGANPALLPAHIVSKENPNTGPYNALPIGCGPFAIDAWLRGQSVTLHANERYWRGRPKLDRVIYNIIPSDETIMTQLRTHELDLWMQMNPSKLEEASTVPGVTVLRRRSNYWWHFDCNCDHPALADVSVRRALDHAIDRDAIVRKILHGAGELNWTVFSPDSFVYNPSVRTYPFDIARANALLDAAGWRRGPGGVRAKDGVDLHFAFAAGAGNETWVRIIELVRQAWLQIGVTFDLRTFQTNLYFAPFESGGIVQAGKFDICAFQWGNTADPTGSINLYSGDRIPPHGQNDLRYRNATVTKLLARASESLVRAEQKALLQQVQAIVADECPTFPIAQSTALYPMNTDLEHFDPNSLSPFDFMMNVDI